MCYELTLSKVLLQAVKHQRKLFTTSINIGNAKLVESIECIYSSSYSGPAIEVNQLFYESRDTMLNYLVTN